MYVFVKGEAEAKKRFAEEYVKTRNAFAAARTLFPETADIGQAHVISRDWPQDPIVLAEIQRIEATQPELAKIVTKTDVLRKLWEIVENERVDVRSKLKAIEDYSEIAGYVEKKTGGAPVNVQVGVSQRVLVIPATGATPADHDKLAEEQQRRLIADTYANES